MTSVCASMRRLRTLQLWNNCEQCPHHRQWRHTGPKALDVHADGEPVPRCPLSAHPRFCNDMWMWQDEAVPTPAGLDLCGRARRQRDQGACRPDQDIELGIMQCALDVVGVTKVVHSQDERLANSRQCGDQRSQVIRRTRIEPKVDVHEFEL